MPSIATEPPASAPAAKPASTGFTPKKTNPKIIWGGLIVILLVVGAVAVSILVNNSQDTRNQAAEPYPTSGCSPSHPTYNSASQKCEFYK